MGLFPIIMNIMQFWLIDSIVKASADSPLALESDSSHPSLDDGAREPLFHSPSDDEDEDEGPAPRHDIENPRQLRSQSRDQQKHTSTSPSVNTEEPKSIGSSTSHVPADPEISVVTHAYPPSIGSGSMSPPSRRASLSPPAGSMHRYQRSSPAPLRLQSAHQPAINSPNPTAKSPKSFQAISEHVALSTLDADSSKDWESSWDDADEWTNKVGDDVAAKQRRSSDAWGTSPPPRQVAAVGF